jgi:hypothetical protein
MNLVAKQMRPKITQLILKLLLKKVLLRNTGIPRI